MGGELFCKKEEEEHLEHTSSRFEVQKNCTPKLLNFRTFSVDLLCEHVNQENLESDSRTKTTIHGKIWLEAWHCKRVRRETVYIVI